LHIYNFYVYFLYFPFTLQYRAKHGSIVAIVVTTAAAAGDISATLTGRSRMTIKPFISPGSIFACQMRGIARQIEVNHLFIAP
jgi:hypothetical protein